ncbi:MAG TPA: hypothetical protein VMT58_07840 [Candidatus Binataceae bacterium]|nr:hypothetical protein [Candidatus Binataceae bacterium]
MKLLAAGATVLTVIIASAPSALACATCFAASSPRALLAYYLSTILLSAMPFALVVAFVLYLKRYRLGAPPPDEPAPFADAE